MTDISAPVRVEPTPDPLPTPMPAPASTATTTAAPATTHASSSADPAPASVSGTNASTGESTAQLSRIEDKTARIEEKYARSEALLLRMGDRVDAAAGVITNEAARQADLVALRNEVAQLSHRTRSIPGAATLLVMAVLTALLTTGAMLAAMKYGVPGVLPPAGPSTVQSPAGSPPR